MVELIVIYCLIWGALIIGAFIADFITNDGMIICHDCIQKLFNKEREDNYLWDI